MNGISVLNLGFLASEYEIYKSTQDVLKETEYSLITLTEVIQAIHFIILTSQANCIKDPDAYDG
ncbi:hypothetical protein F887_03545 [Acinetobacter sp. NIPH 2100]|nr:hypothetical protein F887_03545 [Acinetobacter sp. NIPH 2100]